MQVRLHGYEDKGAVMLQQSEIKKFQHQVVSWQSRHGRHQLPWQQNATPYAVLVSELMLQQTQVVTVIPYFQRWMASFPSIEVLAAASNDEVMAHWQGLGYYARARNLHQAASYGPIVDGNVRRLYARFFAIAGVTSSSAVDKKLWLLAEQLTPDTNCRSFAQGLLDLGATICKPKQPLCEQCPLSGSCQALALNLVDELPTAKPKKTVPVKDGHFIWLQQGENLWLQKRPAPGIWASLWSLPQVSAETTWLQQAEPTGAFVHQFTHYKLTATVWRPEASQTQAVQEQLVGGSWYQRHQLDNIGLPAPIRSFIEQQWPAQQPDSQALQQPKAK